jgi:hypothetical protein
VSALARVVEAVEPAIARHAAPDPPEDRFAGRLPDPDRAFTAEAVYEGYLLHYGEPRSFVGMEPDLRLLAGDALYALGLSRVAERGDLEAVAELSDLISDVARAHAEGSPGRARERWDTAVQRLG